MSNELTTENAFDFLNQFCREQSRKAWIGELLKYVKGHYQIGRDEDEDEIPLGTKMVVIIPSMIYGWVCWEDHHPVAYEMGVIAEGFKVPKREDLGDNEKGDWEKDDHGKPVDPWVKNAFMVMIDEDENIFTYSTSSKGGLSALSELLMAYKKRALAKPDVPPQQQQIPVIELQSTSYKHRIYSKVHTPVFKIVGWEDPEKYEALADGAGDQKEEEAPKAKRISATLKATPPAAKGDKKNAAGKNHRMRF